MLCVDTVLLFLLLFCWEVHGAPELELKEHPNDKRGLDWIKKNTSLYIIYYYYWVCDKYDPL